MRFFTFLVVALGATSVSAKCFKTGQKWSNKDQAREEARIACDEKISGRFARGEKKSDCRNKPGGGVKFNFRIENDKTVPATISPEECTRNIIGEINNCGRGGEVNRNGIIFR
jgi:hypothetical protein